MTIKLHQYYVVATAYNHIVQEVTRGEARKHCFRHINVFKLFKTWETCATRCSDLSPSVSQPSISGMTFKQGRGGGGHETPLFNVFLRPGVFLGTDDGEPMLFYKYLKLFSVAKEDVEMQHVRKRLGLNQTKNKKLPYHIHMK